MANTPENQLIEALKKVDAYGDIAPPHVQDPMTMVLRQNAIQADLIRWDDSRGRFVLTGTGNRITARGRTSGKILSVPKIPSGRIRTVKQNQRIIAFDGRDHLLACNVCRQPVQVATAT